MNEANSALETNQAPKHVSSIFIIIIAVAIVSVGIAAFLLGRYFAKTSNNPEPSISSGAPITQVFLSPTTIAQNSTPTQIPTALPTAVPDLVPQENAIYFGSYEGKDSIFFTNTSWQQYFENGLPKTNKMFGLLIVKDAGNRQSFDYALLQNPRKIYTINSDKYTSLSSQSSFLLSNDENSTYVVLGQADGVNPNVLLIRVDMAKQTGEEILKYKLRGDKYPEKGEMNLYSLTDDKYIVFYIPTCYACDGSDPHGTAVVNVATKEEKYLGTAENVTINVHDNNLTYQKVAPTKEACDPGPGCDNGQRTVYKPSGQIFTEVLP